MNGARRPHLLLVEPAFVLRRTVALTARDLDIAVLHEAPSQEAAERLLGETRFQGLLAALGGGEEELHLLHRIRAGRTLSPSDMPIAVMMEHCGPEDVARLRPLQIKRILVKPYKVKTLLEAMEVLT